jgi:hypothetical protein
MVDPVLTKGQAWILLRLISKLDFTMSTSKALYLELMPSNAQAYLLRTVLHASQHVKNQAAMTRGMACLVKP